jgi:hypothetical protein
LTILIVLTIIAANILHVDDTPFILPEDYILHLASIYGGWFIDLSFLILDREMVTKTIHAIPETLRYLLRDSEY